MLKNEFPLARGEPVGAGFGSPTGPASPPDAVERYAESKKPPTGAIPNQSTQPKVNATCPSTWDSGRPLPLRPVGVTCTGIVPELTKLPPFPPKPQNGCAWVGTDEQTVVLDIEMALDTQKAAETDDIQYALDYKTVSKRIISFVETSQFLLVEKLISEIAGIIRYELNVPWVKITLNKKGAIRGASDVGIIIERGQDLSHAKSLH